MTVEATIEDVALVSAIIGDIVGECKGKVTGYDKLGFGLIVDVTPEPEKCDTCKLSEYCSSSMAE